MNRLHTPWFFLGPNGSGKTTQARTWIEEAHGGKITLPMETRMFSVGDGYEARVYASPYHFEIDIPNLSMQDKQIIGDLLTSFFSSGDVFTSLRTGGRKLIILRRAHSLSLPAAIRVRAIINQYVLPAHASGMLWITAREMTGPLAILEDAFVKHSIPRLPYATWASNPLLPPPLQTEQAWLRCEGRLERAKDVLTFFPDGNIPAWPRRVQDYYDEMIKELIYVARSGKAPTLAIVLWIRSRVYQALSYCQMGPEIMDSCAAAVQRNHELLEPAVFFQAMTALSRAEPHTSYRTPLSLEAGLLSLFEVIQKHSSKLEKPAPKQEDVRTLESFAFVSGTDSASETAAPKAAPKRRVAARKKPSTAK